MKVRRTIRQNLMNIIATVCMTVFSSTSILADDEVIGGTGCQSIPDVEWDAVFSRTEGWTGGDVAGTVDLGDGRTVWVFGDSWIGKVSHGRHASGSHMINNAIAIQRRSSLGKDRAPRYGQISFYWGPDNEEKKPTAWIVPEEHADTHWFWPSGGGIVVPGPDGQSRLILFLFHLTKRGEQDSAWNFRHVGSAMAIVDDAQSPVSDWKVRQVNIPYDIGAKGVEGDAPIRETNWGVGALLRREREGKTTRPYLYIYGVHNAQPTNKQLMLARVPAEKVEQLDEWKFHAGGNRWSSKMTDAVHIADRMASELSVCEVNGEENSTFIIVHSEPLFGRRVLLRSAPAPTGPWSAATPVYTVPGLDRGKDYFTYAAKGHLHLSRRTELLTTYIINANNIWDMAVDAAIYRPRFVRVRLPDRLRRRISARKVRP